MKPVDASLPGVGAGTGAVRRRSSAIRQKRARARRKAGLVCFRLELDEHAVAEALIRAGRLSEAETASHGAVKRELELVIGDWVARWI